MCVKQILNVPKETHSPTDTPMTHANNETLYTTVSGAPLRRLSGNYYSYDHNNIIIMSIVLRSFINFPINIFLTRVSYDFLTSMLPRLPLPSLTDVLARYAKVDCVNGK